MCFRITVKNFLFINIAKIDNNGTIILSYIMCMEVRVRHIT